MKSLLTGDTPTYPEQASILDATSIPRTSSIVVVGVGYVGLPLALHAAKRGFSVIGFDIDTKKIKQLSEREASYITADEQKLLRELPTISFTSKESDIWHADTYIICVPTPVRGNRTPDLKPLESAAAIVGAHISQGALVVIESTVNPGACEKVALPIIERISGLKAEKEFFFAHCPERINPGDSAWDVTNIPRVLGASGKESLEKARKLYTSIMDAEVRLMPSIKEAEAVKMIENAFRDINIAFVNELAMSFDRAEIDLVSVIRGASTKPFSFMSHFPGCGVGGHCIPVDPYYLIRYGEENGFEHRFLKAARAINNKMPQYTVKRLGDALRSQKRRLKGARVALLGLAYKRDIGDIRESPALEIEEGLKSRGARVITYDPHVPYASTARSIREALKNADAAIIATDHAEFRTLTPADFQKANVSIVIDGRNCLSKKAFLESGLTYRGIGR